MGSHAIEHERAPLCAGFRADFRRRDDPLGASQTPFVREQSRTVIG
jgi:hypothetical protein